MRNGIAALALFLIAASAQAQPAVPYTFSPGAPARAAEMNGNFQALLSAINSVDARVARLEGGTHGHASMAGTYRLFGLQTGLFAGKGPGLVESITYTGTITLSPHGTYSGTLDGRQHDLGLNGNGGPAVLSTKTTSDALSGTYTLAQNSKLTLSNFGGPSGIEFYGAPGARTLIAAVSGEEPPPGLTAPMSSDVLLILVRTH